MKNLLILSSFGLFGCLMFLAGLLGGWTKNQLSLGFLAVSAFLFLIPYAGALMLVFDRYVFTSLKKDSPKKVKNPRSETLDSIIMRDKKAQQRYQLMFEDDSFVTIKQEDFDRFFLVQLVGDMVDALLERPSPN